MEKMLVTQALNELKLLDSRITNQINRTGFVTAARTADAKVKPGKTKDEYVTEAKSGYQSINDLITRRAKIKSAIVISNASTNVEVNGETMTVADAIELKSAIDYQVKLLNELKRQYNNALSTANSKNLDMEIRIDQYLTTMFGTEAKTKKDDYAETVEPIRQAQEWSLVDPLDAEQRIKNLEDYIEGFRSSVDSVLQISNCTTWIEIE